MPHPIKIEKSGSIYRSDPKILMRRPEHVARIGLVVAEWASLENILIDLFAHLIFSCSEGEQDSHNIARTSLESLDSLAAKLGIIRALLKTRIEADRFKFYIKEIESDIRKRGGERNLVAHTNWHVCDDYPDHIIAFENYKPIKYNTKDFDDIVDRILSTIDKIATFMVGTMREAALSKSRFGK